MFPFLVTPCLVVAVQPCMAWIPILKKNPVHKKDSKRKKNHYQSISVLPNISKIYERFFFKQISEYFEQFLFKYQCEFRKGFSAQHNLEKCKSAVANKKVFSALLTDLSKAFDCLSHDFLIAKLNIYEFSIAALRVVQNYLSNWRQRGKINTEYSSWEEILFGVPQGFISGSLLFNIFLCDLFTIMNNTEWASYVNENKPYAVGNNIEELTVKQQNASKTLFQWFSDNQLKSNQDKCNFICSTSKKVSLIVENKEINNNTHERLSRVKIDLKLSFNTHIDDICKKQALSWTLCQE